VNIVSLGAGNYTQYFAERATDAGFTVGLANTGWMYGTNWSFGALAAGTTYYFHAKARNLDAIETAYTTLGSTVTGVLLGTVNAPAASTDTVLDAGPNNLTVQWDRNGNPGGEVNASYWTTTTALPAARTAGTLVMVGRWAYYLGGNSGVGNQSTVYYAAVNADGTIGSWATVAALPAGISEHGAGVYGGRLYVVGYDGTEATGSVYMTPWNQTDGTLGAWTRLTALPTSRKGHGFSIYKGRLYVAGGNDGAAAQKTAYSAAIAADGTIGAWRAETDLPGNRQYPSLTGFGNYLYLAGGSDGVSAYPNVYRSSVSADGSAGQWEAVSALPDARFNASTFVNEGWLYVTGGDNGSGVQTTVYRASFTPDGFLGGWQTITPLPVYRRSHASLIYGGQWYMVGGQDGGGVSQSTIYRLPKLEGAQYYAERATDAGFSLNVVNTGWITESGHDFSGLASNTTYYFHVKARNTDGIETGYFTIGSATTTGNFPAAAPLSSISTFTSVGVYSVDVQWDRNNNPVGAPGSWSATAAMPGADYYFGNYAVYNNRVYKAGGVSNQTSVWMTGINSDGTLSGWTSLASTLPAGRAYHAAVTAKGYLYVITGNATNTVYYARLNADGTAGVWNTTTNYPLSLYGAAGVYYGGRIYVSGGTTGNTDNTQTSAVYSATVNDDGTLGTWTAETGTPAVRSYHSLTVANGRLYSVGGSNSCGGCGTPYQGTSTVYMAPIQANGSLGSWSTVSALATSNAALQAMTSSGRLYAIGGNFTQSSFQTAVINADGTLGPWSTLTSFGNAYAQGAFTLGGRIYAGQGPNGAGVNIVALGAGNYTQYFAERATDAGFTTGLANTGWMYGTNWSFGALAAGTTYYFHAKARNLDLAETSFTNLGSTRSLPGPLNSASPFTAVAVSSIAIEWRWSGPGGEDGFRVLQATSGNNLSGSLPAGTTSWLQNGLISGTTYGARVEAFNTVSASATLNVQRYTLPPTPGPASPLFRSVYTSSFTVEWTSAAAVNGTNAYFIQASTDPGYGGAASPGWVASSTSSLFTGLFSNTTYYVRVKGRSPDLDETPYASLGSTRTLLSAAPAPPAGFAGVALSTETILWTWQDQPDAQSYRVKQASSGADFSGLLAERTTWWLQAGLSPNTSSGMTVEAANALGTALSASATVYTLTFPPGALAVTAKTTGTVSLSWSANGNPAGTVYELSYSSDNFVLNFSTPVAFAAVSTVTVAAVGALQPGQDYWFRARSQNAVGTPSNFSNIVSTAIYALHAQSLDAGVSAVLQGATTGLMTLRVWSDSGRPVYWPSLYVVRLGTAADNNFDNVALYKDNGNGLFDGPGLDPAASTPQTFSGGAATLALTANAGAGELITGTTQIFYLGVAVSQNNLPLPGVTVGVSISSTGFGVGGGAILPLTGVSSSSLATILDSGDLLRVSTQNAAPAQLSPGQGDAPMLKLNFSTNRDFTSMTGLRVERLGSGPDSDLVSAGLYRDNGDGVLTGADTLLGGGTFLNGVSTLTLAGAETVSTTGGDYFLTVTVAGTVSGSSSIGLRIAGPASFLLSGGVDAASALNLPADSTVAPVVAAIGSVTASVSTGVWITSAVFSGNFGQSNVSYFRTVWDRNAGHAWSGSETLWLSGNSTQTASTDALDWRFHWKSYDAFDNPGTSGDIGPFYFDSVPPSTSAFLSLGWGGVAVPESGWNGLLSGVTVQITVADATAGMSLATGSYSAQYSTNAGNNWNVVLATGGGAAAWVSLTGAQGSTAAQTLSVMGLTLASSTSAATCGGMAPCSATNQIRFAATDVKGNSVTAGPFAVLVDTGLRVFVQSGNIAPAGVAQGGYAGLLSLKLQALNASTTWGALVVEQAGTASDADIAQVRVYRDANGNGTFEQGSDIAISNSNIKFVGGVATVTLPTPETLTTSSQTYFVAFQADPGAAQGVTFVARLSGAASFSFGSYSAKFAATPPLLSGPATVADGANNLSVVGADLAPVSAAPGASDVPLLRLLLQTDQGSSRLDRLVFRLTGTAASNDVSALKIYRDANGNGTFEPGVDSPVTSGADIFTAGVCTAAFTSSAASATARANPAYFFAAVNLSGGASEGKTLGMTVLSTSSVILATALDTVTFPSGAPASAQLWIGSANTLSLTPTSLAPATFVQGAEYALFKATLTVDAGQLDLTRLAVTRTGTAQASDVSVVKVYEDLSPGGPFNPPAFTLLGSAAFSGTSASVAIGTRTLVSGTTYVYFVSYTLSPSAVVGRTLGARMSNSASLTVAGPVTTVAAAFPIDSGTGTISSTLTGLFVSGQDMAPADLPQGATAQPLLTLVLNTTAYAVPWTGVTLASLGTALDADIDRIRVLHDANADGLLDGGDTEIASLANPFNSGTAIVSFGSAQSIGTAAKRYFIAVDVNANANPSRTFGIGVTLPSSVIVSAPNFVVNSGFPMNSGAVPFSKIPDTLTLAASSLLPSGLVQGGEAAAARLSAWTGRGSVVWSGLRVAKLGGLADGMVDGVDLYKDVNGDGARDGADLFVGSAAFAGAAADIVFSSAQTVGVSTGAYLLTLRINAAATVGATLGVAIQNASALTLAAPDAGAATNLPFATPAVPVLDIRTPVQPAVVISAGAYSSSFESIPFVWTSTVGMGSIVGAEYAVGTTPGGAQIAPFTAMSAAPGAASALGLALANGTTCYVSVRATSSFGLTSTIGSSAGVLVDYTKPASPQVIALVGQTSLMLNWSPVTGGASGVRGYVVEYRRGDSPLWLNVKTNAATRAAGASPAGVSVAAVPDGDISQAPLAVSGLSGTIFVRVMAASGAGVLSDPSPAIRVQLGAPAAQGLSSVSVYPNPFDSRARAATIAYTMSAAESVNIDIYDAFGRRVRAMNFSAGAAGALLGTNEVSWDGSDDSGRKVSMGLYFCVVRSASSKAVFKVGVIH
jgi:hypothetical protein